MKPKRMITHFEPLDEREHQKGRAGQDVPDYCRNCFRPFMEHVNGACPPDCASGAGMAVDLAHNS